MKNAKSISTLIIILSALSIALFVVLGERSGRQISAATQAVSSGLTEHALQHDGRQRTYFVLLPHRFSDEERLPVVFALHGGGRNDGRALSARLNFKQLADEQRFIVVYPNGVDNQWNDGRGVSFRKDVSNVDVDDVGFISTLIDRVLADYHADPSRVYVTGASNGGMMTYRVGCELTTKIAAIAPIIANLPDKIADKSVPQGPLPVLVINGTDDPLVPWAGGQVTVFNKAYGRVLSTRETVEFWVANNRLSDAKSVRVLPDINANDGSVVHVTRFGDQAAAAPVLLYEIRGGGHTLPGLRIPSRARRMVGNTNQDISTVEVVWNFFKMHQRD